MSIKCKKGIGYECPHMQDCDSDEGLIHSINSLNPHAIYISSSEWSSTTRTWSDKQGLYVCQPENQHKTRNIDLIKENTFYGQSKKRVKENLAEEILRGIEELMVSKRLITRGR